jgi:hypothetical protein
VGAALALTLGACSSDPVGPIACVLGGVEGDLVRQGDRVVLVDARWNARHWDRLGLRLPAGWAIHSTEGSELDVIDGNGVPVARTGGHARLGAAMSDTAVEPMVVDGVLVVCPSGT